MEPETITLKDGRVVAVRNSMAGDGEMLHAYLLALGASTEFILTYPGDMFPVERFEDRAQRVDTGEFYSIVAIDPETGVIVGNSSFGFGARKKLAHNAELGTGVIPSWQGIGLGSWMLNQAIEDMRANPKIHRLELTVMNGNDHALAMYQQAGFEVEGRKIKSIRQPDGEYCDEIMMGMWIGE